MQGVNVLQGEQWKRISEKAVTVWKIYGTIVSCILLVGTVIYSVLSFFFDWYKWLIPVFVILVVLVFMISIWFLPGIRYQIWRYRINEHEIEIQHGLFIVTKTLIPIIRVQHVDWTQGPILKKFGLATITIHTAATIHEIPALIMEDAEELRKRISLLARVADEDV